MPWCVLPTFSVKVDTIRRVSVETRQAASLQKISLSSSMANRATTSGSSGWRPLEAALSQATANEAHDEASLAQAQANQARDSAQAKYTDSQATAYEQLFRDKVVSRDQIGRAHV